MLLNNDCMNRRRASPWSLLYERRKLGTLPNAFLQDNTHGHLVRPTGSVGYQLQKFKDMFRQQSAHRARFQIHFFCNAFCIFFPEVCKYLFLRRGECRANSARQDI
jgi:hypothetical protein